MANNDRKFPTHDRSRFVWTGPVGVTVGSQLLTTLKRGWWGRRGVGPDAEVVFAVRNGEDDTVFGFVDTVKKDGVTSGWIFSSFTGETIVVLVDDADNEELVERLFSQQERL